MAAEMEQQVELAKKVSAHFLNQFYMVLMSSTDDVAKFYSGSSTMRYNGSEYFVGNESIRDAYVALGMSSMEADIQSVSYLPSHEGGIVVVTSGTLTSADSSADKKFSQTFFLAPSHVEGRYFVLSDILVVVDGPAFSPTSTTVETVQEPQGVQDEQLEESENDEAEGAEVAEEEEQEEDEVQDDQVDDVVEEPEVAEEEKSSEEKADVPEEKKPTGTFSYARAVASNAAAPAPPQPPVARPAAKPAKPAALPNGKPAAPRQGGKKAESKKPESFAAIFVKDLRKEWTQDFLKEFFSTFGAVESVDIPAGKQYAFVYFESADAVKAVLSAPVVCEGKNLVCEEKNTGRAGRSRGGNKERRGGKGQSFKAANGGRRPPSSGGRGDRPPAPRGAKGKERA